MVALTGNDLTILNSRPLADLADRDCVLLDFPNNIAEGKKGKNGNSIISINETGEQTTVTIRVIKGSPDDKFLNQELSTFKNNRSTYILIAGTFIKKVGDGAGNVTNEIFTMSNGFVSKYPNSKDNAEGDTEQGVTEYTLTFMNTDRTMS